ncbi:MAG: ABC transporter substrate-binding protein [bacterium]|nr:ABC transporter substrate-binding protein [bacterium]
MLPSATEMVCAVGARAALVGRSHECDYPIDVSSVPVLTRPRRELPRASGAIDRAVREILADAIAVYEVDIPVFETVRPDVVVTQDLCDVCAVSLDDVRSALRELARCDVQVCSLKPTRLRDVWDDVRRVGRALGRDAEGDLVAAELEARCTDIGYRSATLDRPTVLTVEWLDPIMIGGTWMPELVELAGGHPLVTRPGDHAPTLGIEELAALEPDVVLIKPCGFDLSRTAKELHLLADNLPWTNWQCVRDGQVYVADGNAYFNRPGPRLVESLEILASVVQPGVFSEMARQHVRSVRRVTAELELVPVAEPRGPA